LDSEKRKIETRTQSTHNNVCGKLQCRIYTNAQTLLGSGGFGTNNHRLRTGAQATKSSKADITVQLKLKWR